MPAHLTTNIILIVCYAYVGLLSAVIGIQTLRVGRKSLLHAAFLAANLMLTLELAPKPDSLFPL